MTLRNMSEDHDNLRIFQYAPVSPGSSRSSRSPLGSPRSVNDGIPCEFSHSRSSSPVSYATDLSMSGQKTLSPGFPSRRLSPVMRSPVRRCSSSVNEVPRTSPLSRITSPIIPRAPLRQHQPHQSTTSKCSNFSINSILSSSGSSGGRSSTHSKDTSLSPPPVIRTSPPNTPEKSDRSKFAPLSPQEVLMKMDAAHMNLAAAAAAFHPRLNPAFLERSLPGGLPGKPTPWYPWFAAAAGAYLPFPFDRKYNSD